MMKFKKFLAASMTGAMMFGMVAAAVPATNAYAATSVKTSVVEKNTNLSSPIVFQTARTDQTSPTSSAITTAEYIYNDGPCLKLDSDFAKKSNYIYVRYYDLNKDGGKNKLKSTIIYTKNDLCLQSSPKLGYGYYYLPLGGINLKKGAVFNVYNETIDPDTQTVNDIMVNAQSAKIKIKANDLSSNDLLTAFTITIGSAKDGIKFTDAEKYMHKIFIDGEDIFSYVELYNEKTEEDEEVVVSTNKKLLENMKVKAKAGGATFNIEYYENESCIPSEAKIKLSAASKAPSIKIDYTKGTFTIKKKLEYAVVGVKADGSLEIPTEFVPVSSADKIFKIGDLVSVSGSAVTVYEVPEDDYVQGTNYYTHKYVEVKDLTAAQFVFDQGNEEIRYYVVNEDNQYVRAEEFTENTKYFTLDKGYSVADVKDEDDFWVLAEDNNIFIAKTAPSAAIIVQTSASGKKLASLMTIIPVKPLENAVVTYKDNGGFISFAGKKVADFSFTDTGVKLVLSTTENDTTTKRDILNGEAKVRSNKEITLAAGASLTLTIPGRKEKKNSYAADFGSVAFTLTRPAGSPSASEEIEIIEARTDLTAWADKVVYYTDKDAKNKVDKTTLATPEANTTYYVKAVYKVVDSTKDPVSGTSYYTTKDNKAFEKATLTDNKFAANTVYYTRTEKTE